MVDIDEWIPNFEMFVLFVLPVLILITIAVFFLEWYEKRPKKKLKFDIDWMDLMKFATALYLLVPIYRIIRYVEGKVGVDELVRGLFVTDFFNYMLIALLTGIIGLVFILKNKAIEWKTWGDKPDW